MIQTSQKEIKDFLYMLELSYGVSPVRNEVEERGSFAWSSVCKIFYKEDCQTTTFLCISGKSLGPKPSVCTKNLQWVKSSNFLHVLKLFPVCVLNGAHLSKILAMFKKFL